MTCYRLFLPLLILTGWLSPLLQADEVESIPFTRSVIPYVGGPHFTKLSPQMTRVPYIHEVATWHPDKRLFHSSFACGAILLGDLDKDGQTDLFITGGPRPNALYLQAGNLTFVDLSSGMGLKGAEGWAAGAAMIDIDEDEDLDIYICYYDRPNELYINQLQEGGGLGFTEAAAEYGLDIADASLVPAFCDYDRDGDLDLYLLTHQLVRPNGRPSSAVPTEVIPGTQKARITGDPGRYYKLADRPDAEGRWTYSEAGRADYLLRNDGGKFKDVSKQAGISRERLVGNSATWWDFDEDGWPDLYVANQGEDEDILYRNKGNGTFEDVSKEVLPRTPMFSTGAVVMDANGDGHLDLLVGDRAPTSHFKRQVSMPSPERFEAFEKSSIPLVRRNSLFLNAQTRAVLEAAQLYGIGETDWTWSIKSGDYDHDGLPDLFFANGAPRHFDHADLEPPTHEKLVGQTHWDLVERASYELKERNLAFRNTGTGFVNVSKEWGLDDLGMSLTSAQGDLDEDGDLDLIVSLLGEPLVIYRNDGATGNSIRVKLRGTKSNLGGIGAVLRLESEERTQVRQVYPAWGYMDADEATVHFGLGRVESVEKLEITWPSGIVQKLEGLKVNHTHIITEPQATKPSLVKPREPWFTKSRLLEDRSVEEARFEDFEKQELLPLQLSHFGPAQAWGDIDGDGDDDLFLGGAAGSSGLVLHSQISASGESRFRHKSQWALEQDAASEDMGAVLFDSDQDGDLDLYVVHGGVETEPDSEALRDGYYENRGDGEFRPFPKDHLPDLRESGSCVTAADFDQDGDLDLFVGTRSRTGAYGEPCTSRLLVNDGGTFVDGTEDVAMELKGIGMVTSAVWSDINEDGWVDLVIALDWGPIVVLRNRGGYLEKIPVSGTQIYSGRWNAVAAGDLDNDGDMDLVATNLGLNTPFKASENAPQLLFHGDMSGEGKSHLIQAEFEAGVAYPYLGYKRFSQALPWVSEQIPTSQRWASMSLPQIFGLDRLRDVELLKVTELRSGIFLNDGDGFFNFHPLPQIAQVAPGFGIGLGDFDANGFIDLFIAQNFSYSRPETGVMVGGLGQLLRRNPDAMAPAELFDPVPVADSAIHISQDARSVAVADVNQDRKVDLIVGVNGDSPQLYLNDKPSLHLPFTLRLIGPESNRQAIGSRVTVSVPGMPIQTREVTCGSGFLSASPVREHLFAKPEWASEVTFVEVTWPNGQQRSYTFKADQLDLVVQYEEPKPLVEPEATDADLGSE